jgi:hypothetical protein
MGRDGGNAKVEAGFGTCRLTSIVALARDVGAARESRLTPQSRDGQLTALDARPFPSGLRRFFECSNTVSRGASRCAARLSNAAAARCTSDNRRPCAAEKGHLHRPATSARLQEHVAVP